MIKNIDDEEEGTMFQLLTVKLLLAFSMIISPSSLSLLPKFFSTFSLVFSMKGL